MPIKVYNTLADNINKSRYHVLIPEWYSPAMSKLMEQDPDFIPPYAAGNGDDMSESFLPLAYLIDMCFNDVTFIFMDPSDTQHMINIINQYLTLAKRKQVLSPKDQAFVTKCNKALLVIKPLQKLKDFRHAKANPEERGIESLLEEYAL